MSLDKSDYEKGISEAKQQGQDLAEHTKNKVGPMAAAGWAAIAAAVIALTKKMADLAVSTAKYADQIGDLAEKWGFTTKQIQEFDYWATQNGTTLEGLLTGMRGLVNQAQAGSNAFARLGISVRNTDGTLKDQRQLFMETITALQGVENQTERNALQFDIFGRSGVELGQIINKTGAELEALSQKAQDYGLIISDEAIKKSSDFNDELDTLKRQFQSLVAEMLTGSPEAEEKFNLLMENIKDKIQKYLPNFLKFMIKFLQQLVEGIINALPDLVDALFEAIYSLNWFELGWKLAGKILEGLAKALWEGIQMIFGKGWLWGGNNNVEVVDTSTQNAISTVNSSVVNERTTKVDETLEITLNVESDGTVAGEKNLDTISDLLVDKINKALGDMVNG